MIVEDLMSHDKLELAYENTSFKQLWKLIFKHKINALPVVDKSNNLLGIISEEDLLKQLYPSYGELVEEFSSIMDFESMESKINDLSKMNALDLMSKRVIFTRSETPVMRALSRMIARGIDQLPVVSGKNKVIGIITKGDIFKGLFKRQLNKHNKKL